MRNLDIADSRAKLEQYVGLGMVGTAHAELIGAAAATPSWWATWPEGAPRPSRPAARWMRTRSSSTAPRWRSARTDPGSYPGRRYQLLGQAVRGQSGHPPFGAGERVRTGERGAPRPGARSQQLLPGPLGQGRRAGAPREILGAEQRGPRVPGMACPAQVRTQVAQGPGQVVPGLRGFQQVDRFSQVFTGLIRDSRGAGPAARRRRSAGCRPAGRAPAARGPGRPRPPGRRAASRLPSWRPCLPPMSQTAGLSRLRSQRQTVNQEGDGHAGVRGRRDRGPGAAAGAAAGGPGPPGDGDDDERGQAGPAGAAGRRRRRDGRAGCGVGR